MLLSIVRSVVRWNHPKLVQTHVPRARGTDAAPILEPQVPQSDVP